ncbi:thioesterase II family protein [Thermoactinospora rubra]|uniref:thioesterase II family protein n=1 Tax=Thermoactinospora rubra TaxID=1088767 RepID=UPI000A10A894|nr:alpha/beta fold hydrolase [Thermoactinospora rubra]
MTIAPGKTSLWIRRFSPAPEAASRVVCLPHAGGSAPYYFPMSKALAPEFEVLAVQYPGRQDRRAEPCIDSITELADHVARELREWIDRPMTLFGHSMGATLAFEVARRLEGEAPLLGVIASGRCAPSRGRGERVHLLDDRLIVEELRALSGTDARLLGDEEVIRMIMPAIRSDYRAAETYRCAPGVTIPYPVLAMVGDSDDRTSVEEAAAWAEHTTSSFELRVFPGGHFYLNDHAAAVVDTVAEQIRRWSADRSDGRRRPS